MKDNSTKNEIKEILADNLMSLDDIISLYFIPEKRTLDKLLKSQNIIPIFKARKNYYLREEIEKFGFIRRDEASKGEK